MCFFMHVQSYNGWIDSNQILHIGSLSGCRDILATTSKLLRGFARGGVQILAFLIGLALASNTAHMCDTLCSRCEVSYENDNTHLDYWYIQTKRENCLQLKQHAIEDCILFLHSWVWICVLVLAGQWG